MRTLEFFFHIVYWGGYVYQIYKVEGSDTLDSIARRFDITVDKLREINGLGELYPGGYILVPSSNISNQNNNNIYYSYRKVNDNYDVYISYADMPSLYTRTFSISSIDRVQYAKDFVYYIEDDVLYSYSSKTGVNKVLTYQEFYYNSDLKFWIYEKWEP